MPRVTYIPQEQALEIDLDGQSVRVAGLADPPFVRHGSGPSPEGALWVSTAEAEVLAKMIEYVLGKVRITSSSRAALESVLPRVREAASGQSPVAGKAPGS